MVDITDNFVCVRLTFGELAFIATVTGIGAFYSFDPSRGNMSDEELQVVIRDGKASLELRNLVKKQGLEDLTVDRALYLFLRPVLLPEWILKVETHRLDSIDHFAVFYRGQYVFVEFNQGQYNLFQFRERNMVQACMLSKAGIDNQNKIDENKFEQGAYTFASRFQFITYCYEKPTESREMTILGNDHYLWLRSKSKSDQPITSAQVKAMEWI